MFFIFPAFIACSAKQVSSSDSTASTSETKRQVTESTNKIVIGTPVLKKRQDLVVSYLLPFQINTYPTDEIPDLKVYEQSAIAIDYLNGAKIAIDSIHKEYNEKITVNIFDSQNDSNRVKLIIRDSLLAKSTIIFGPVFPSELSAIANFSRENNIPVVSPISPALLNSFQNPYFISANNTLEAHAQQMASFLKRNGNTPRILIVHEGTSSEERYINSFIKTLDSLNAEMFIEGFNTTTNVNDSISAHLNPAAENFILIPSADQAYVIGIFKMLNLMYGKYSLTVLGHPVWADFSSVDLGLMQAFKVHISTSIFVDYNSPKVISFIKHYRELYGVDPSDNAFRGFDQTYYFLSQIIKDHKFNLNKLKPEKEIATRFSFRSFGNAGYKNEELFVVKYQDYQLVVQP